MATYSLMISVTDVKQTSYVDENVDDTIIRNVIWNAQQLHIIPLLGTGLYDDIEDAVLNNNPTTDETTLLNKIRPVLIWYTLYDGVIPFAIKIRNKGIMKSNSDNSQSVDDRDLKWLMDHFKDIAEEYAERCKNYLVENAATKFTKYNNAGSGADIIHPEKNQYSTGWVMKSKKKCCNDYDRFENPGECCE